jgi:hypothetical protein
VFRLCYWGCTKMKKTKDDIDPEDDEEGIDAFDGQKEIESLE